MTETTAENGRAGNGTFTKGNPGRPKGAKNKLQEAFWKDFAAAWEANGATALNRVIEEDPATFVKVAASVMPKDLNLDSEVRYVIFTPESMETSEWEQKYSGQALQ